MCVVGARSRHNPLLASESQGESCSLEQPIRQEMMLAKAFSIFENLQTTNGQSYNL